MVVQRKLLYDYTRGRRYYSADDLNEYLVHSALNGDLDEVKCALKSGSNLKLFGERIVDFVRVIKNYSVKYYIIDLILKDEYIYNLVKNRYIKELTKDTGNFEFITLYRAIEVDDNYLEYLSKQGKHLGIYWTYDKEQAYSHWGSGKKNEIIFTAIVNIKSINLDTSIFLYLDEFYNEKEIRLFKGTPLNITNIELNGEFIDVSVLNNRQLYAGFSKHKLGRRH